MVILATIRELQFATRRHVISIHDMGSIQNAKRIMGDLKPYVSKTMQGGPVLPVGSVLPVGPVTHVAPVEPVGPVGN